jgi:hypothetical protein
MPTVFYLFITGTAGSGKSCLLIALKMLGRGLLLGDITTAAMARELGRGREVHLESDIRVAKSKMDVLYHLGCFDEYDTKRKGDDRQAAMDSLLRHGYKADGPGYVRWDMEKNKSNCFDLYMPKVAAVISTLDPALGTRGFRVSAVSYDKPDGFETLLNNRYPKGVTELVQRLDEWGDAVTQVFNKESIETLERSEEHGKRVAAITGSLGLNRQNEHALTCSTICYMIGIEITEELRHGNETIGVSNEEYEDEIEELNNALLAVAGEQTFIEVAESITVKQSRVKKSINDERVRNHLKPCGDRRFAEIYRAAGIKTSWIRGRGGRNWWVVPITHLQVLKGIGGLPHSPHSANLPDLLDQQILKVDQVDQVDQGGEREDQAAKVRQLHEDSKVLPHDDLIDKYGPDLVEREKIPKLGGRE